MMRNKFSMPPGTLMSTSTFDQYVTKEIKLQYFFVKFRKNNVATAQEAGNLYSDYYVEEFAEYHLEFSFTVKLLHFYYRS